MDSASLNILISRLSAVAEEMGTALRKSAYSPNIKERADCSAAVFDEAGSLLAQAEHIPVHLGAMPASVIAAIDAHGDDLEPGQQVIVNDPFAGGSHLNDVTLVAPVFAGDQRVGWVANRAHHADIGGDVPGSIPPEATEINQEGLRIPPTIYDDSVVDQFVKATRAPEERVGDLLAQVGANQIGVQRFGELQVTDFGEVLDYGEQRMLACLAQARAGTYRSSLDIESIGGSRKQLSQGAQIDLCLTVSQSHMEFDFSQSSAQARGNLNAVRSVTESAVAFALRSALDPTMPANGGLMRPIGIHTKQASIVDAQPPVAVGAGNVEVSERIAEVCLDALANVSDRVAAHSQGTMNNLLIGGDGWVYYETIGGGQGALPSRDGMSGVHAAMSNTADTPVEAFERTYPIRVRSYGLRRGSGGRGKFNGGDGIVKELEFLEPATVSIISERREQGAPGRAGGDPGLPGRNLKIDQQGRQVVLPAKGEFRFGPGEVLRIETPGGGGYG